MVNKSTLATVTGASMAVASALFYASGISIESTRELVVNGTGLIAVAAFIAVLAYEDWSDAKRNMSPHDRRHRS